MLLDDEEPVDGVLDEALPLSEDLLSEPLLLFPAGALLEDEPRLSVR